MSRVKTPEEWIGEYERRTGGKFKLRDDELILFEPERGFVTFFMNYEDKCIEGHYIVGDGRFWFNEMKKIMRAVGFDKARFFTRRNPKAWIRKYGGHIRGYYMEVGLDEAK